MSVAIATRESRPGLPPLTSGDRLNQRTFHARYEVMPENFRAELVGGVVYVSSPVTNWHAVYHAQVVTWLGYYAARTPGVEAADNGTVILDDENEPQPDGILRIVEQSGGSSRIDARGYVIGPPELHVEVAYTSEAIDLHDKREHYARTGVREYLVVLIQEQKLRGFRLRGNRFADVKIPNDGIWKSTLFEGLWLPVRAMFDRDMSKVIDTLNAGLATPGHGEFASRLAGIRE
jgi:Uma2 family endonuclease